MEEDSEDSDGDLKYTNPNDPIAKQRRQQKLDQYFIQQENLMLSISNDDNAPVLCNYKNPFLFYN
jgi:hypothetical protein